MITTFTDPARLRYQLVGALVKSGRLRSPQWISAFCGVPRERFVDRFVAVDTARGELAEHDVAGADPAAAVRAVYTDSSLVTQWDAGGTATSSSTAPSLMAVMLEHLDTHPGHRVLEVGTGAGYNAALLCHALGADAVTTMDIHPRLVEQAADRLGRLGYTPRVIIGDGCDGVPEHGPYDRIIATCAFDRVPAAWRSQLVFDGVVVVNVGRGLAILQATPTGLSGPFAHEAAFEAARTDTTDTAYTVGDALARVTDDWPDRRERIATWPAHLGRAAVGFLRSLLMPGVTYVERRAEHNSGAGEITLVDPVSASWSVATASGDSSEAGMAPLAEHGPRPLWDELAALVTEWNDHGRPAPDRYGLTVRLDGTHVLWLDTPERVVRVLPCRAEVR